MKITLNLKKNLKMTKRSKSDPRKKKQMRATFLVVSGTLYGTVSSILQMQAIEVWSYSPNKTVTTRRENKLSRR
jgi:hypothetical protein